MGIASKYNNGSVDWGINTEDFEYHPLSDAGAGTEILVRGLFINNKGKYGPSPVLIAPHCYYNLPGYLTETVQKMLTDEDLIQAIKERKVAAEVRTFKDKTYNKDSWTVDWRDL